VLFYLFWQQLGRFFLFFFSWFFLLPKNFAQFSPRLIPSHSPAWPQTYLVYIPLYTPLLLIHFFIQFKLLMTKRSNFLFFYPLELSIYNQKYTFRYNPMSTSSNNKFKHRSEEDLLSYWHDFRQHKKWTFASLKQKNKKNILGRKNNDHPKPLRCFIFGEKAMIIFFIHHQVAFIPHCTPNWIYNFVQILIPNLIHIRSVLVTSCVP